MNKQGNVFGSVGKQFGGIAKSAVKRVVREPIEVFKTAVGAQDGGESGGEQDNQAMEVMDSSKFLVPSSWQGEQREEGDGGFATRGDFDKYVEGSENRDEVQLRMARRELEREWGVGEGIEVGMERVRREQEQKEEERGQVEEQEKERAEAMKYEKEKQENAQVKVAKDGASPEKRGKMG